MQASSLVLVPTALLDRCLSCSDCWPGTLAASLELSSALKPGDQVSPHRGATQISRVLAHKRAPGLTVYWDESPGIMPSVTGAIYQAMLLSDLRCPQTLDWSRVQTTFCQFSRDSQQLPCVYGSIFRQAEWKCPHILPQRQLWNQWASCLEYSVRHLSTVPEARPSMRLKIEK